MYTAKVETPYGVIEVEHDGTLSDTEIINRANAIGRQGELLAPFSAKTPDQLAVPEKIEQEDPDPSEEDLMADLVQTATRVGAGPLNVMRDIVNGVGSLTGSDDEIMSAEFIDRTKRTFVDALGGLVGVEPEDVFEEDMSYKPYTTTTGAVSEMVPYVAGGAGAAKAIATVAPKLPILVNGVLSGVAVDQLLYEGKEGNLAKSLSESEYLPVEGMLKDIVEFMAVDEADSALRQRTMVTLEGLAIGGGLEGALRLVGKGKDFFFPKDGTIEEQVEAGIKHLEDSRDSANVNKASIHSDLQFSETPEGIAQIEMQASSPIKRFMNQMFSSRGYWTPTGYNLFRGKVYAERQLVREAENIANRLQKSLDNLDYTIPEEVLNNFFTGKNFEEMSLEITRIADPQKRLEWLAADMGIPQDVAKELIRARELVDTLSGRLANSSIPNEEFRENILSNVGEYVRRSYRMFEDTNFKPNEDLKKRTVMAIQNSLMAADETLSEPVAFERALGEVNKILDKRTDYAGLDYASKATRVNREILTGKKEIDPLIRQLMGEITDPADNILLTVSKMAKLVESNQFAENIYKVANGKYIFDSAVTRNNTDYTVKITGTNSVLDGKYTTPEMVTALAGRQSHFGIFDNDLMRSFAALKGGSQAMKTIGSHVTHLRNMLGGAQFGLANGINPFSDGVNTYKTLVNAAKAQGDEGFDALYEKYLGLGVINTNVRVGEFRNLLKEASEIKVGSDPRTFFGKLRGYGTAAGKPFRGVYEAAEKLYTGVDDFYKINAFNTELEVLKKAKPNESLEVLEREAAQIVQDTFPNYDKVPNGIKAFRYLPIGGFVSFPSEIVRTSVNIVKQASDEITSGNAEIAARGRRRLAGFTASMGAWEGIAVGSAALFGMSEEENKALQELSHTPWSKARKIPVRVGDQIYTADTQFIDSYSFLKEPVLEAYHRIESGQLKDEELLTYLGGAAYDGLFKLLAPYADQAIVTEALDDVRTAIFNDNGRTATGKELFPRGETIPNKVIAAFEHTANAFLPGSITSLDNIYTAAVGEQRGSTGEEKKDLGAELLANLTGIKFTPVNVKERLTFRARQYGFDVRNTMTASPDYEKPAEEVARRFSLRQEQHYRDQQDLYLAVQSASEFMDIGEIWQTLTEAGLGMKAARKIMLNQFAPENMPELEKYTRTPDLDAEGMRELYDTMKKEQMQYIHTPLIPVEEDGMQYRNTTERYAKGGQVLVPQAPLEPDERIDKMTGRPYIEQAGGAFIDEEERSGFAGGGITRRYAVAKGGKIDKKKMKCNKPRRTPNHPKKSHVVKACEGGKEKIIRFGEQGAKTAGKPKAGESKRMKAKRKSFKARHGRNIRKGKMSAAYWADKVKW